MTDERRFQRKTAVGLAIATAVLTAAIFVVDTITVPDIAVATLYVLVVLILETNNDIGERRRMEDALQQAQSDVARLSR